MRNASMYMGSSGASQYIPKTFGFFLTISFHALIILVLLHDRIALPILQVGHSIAVQLLNEEKNLPATPIATPLNPKSPQLDIELPQLMLPLGKSVPPQPMVTISAKFSPDVALSVPAVELPEILRGVANVYNAEITATIIEDGSIGEIHIEKSDGSVAMDSALLHYARLHWRFIPSMNDGVPVMSWKTVRVEVTAKGMLVRN